jgi:hypothetical protein
MIVTWHSVELDEIVVDVWDPALGVKCPIHAPLIWRAIRDRFHVVTEDVQSVFDIRTE